MSNPEERPKIVASSNEARATICKVLSRIQEDWCLSNADMAGLVHARPNTYSGWMRKCDVPLSSPLSPESEAIVHLIAIHRSLSAMFKNPKDQIIWLSSSHPDMDRKMPKVFISESFRNLVWVRSYLDYVRGRGA